jgi:integrase
MRSRVDAYLAFRRAMGFQLKAEGRMLLHFARYADRHGHKGPPTNALMVRWASSSNSSDRLYRARRLEVVRAFAKHWVTIEPKSEIPPDDLFGPAHRRNTPYIYSDREIAALLKGAVNLPGKIRPRTYQTLLGLLATTGLRISEALHLQIGDVDLAEGLLVVRNSKHGKTRWVPLHRTSIGPLRKYLGDRLRHSPSTPAFFVSDRGLPLAYRTVCHTFDLLRPRLPKGCRRPRLHDLRHTFACRVLLRWQSSRAGASQRVPILSRYLGHAHVTDTYWYLEAIPKLTAEAGRRFEPRQR